MATQMKVNKLNTLPGTYEASALYLVKSADANLLDLYVASNDGNSVRRIISKSDINTMINAAVAASSSSTIVADITARNALNPAVITIAYVLDATADNTVTAGGATYIYNTTGSTWIKIAEFESMDVVLQWTNIQNRPTSLVSEIDDAVGKRHDHANSTTLAKWGQDGNGNPTYDGNNLQVYLNSDQW